MNKAKKLLSICESIQQGDRVFLTSAGWWKSRATAMTEEWSHEDRPGHVIILKDDSSDPSYVVNRKTIHNGPLAGKTFQNLIMKGIEESGSPYQDLVAKYIKENGKDDKPVINALENFANMCDDGADEQEAFDDAFRKFAHGTKENIKHKLKGLGIDIQESKDEGFKVIWTDRDYKEFSKNFSNSKLGSPDEAENKARSFMKKLEKDENIRSVSMKSINEAQAATWVKTTADGNRALEYFDKSGSGETYVVVKDPKVYNRFEVYAIGWEDDSVSFKVDNYDAFKNTYDKSFGHGPVPGENEYNYLVTGKK
jgi:hypothetical protein